MAGGPITIGNLATTFLNATVRNERGTSEEQVTQTFVDLHTLTGRGETPSAKWQLLRHNFALNVVSQLTISEKERYGFSPTLQNAEQRTNRGRRIGSGKTRLNRSSCKQPRTYSRR